MYLHHNFILKFLKPKLICSVESCNIYHNRISGIEVMSSDIKKIDFMSAFQISNCRISSNRLYGIVFWEKEELIDGSHFLSGNEIVDNERNNFYQGEKLTGIEGVKAAIESNLCTYTSTGPHFIRQEFFRCATCNFSDETATGVCSICAGKEIGV